MTCPGNIYMSLLCCPSQSSRRLAVETFLLLSIHFNVGKMAEKKPRDTVVSISMLEKWRRRNLETQ
jgi:hypothetical protein